jgi:hypothetical protein
MLDAIFGVDPNYALLSPFQGDLKWLYGVMIGVGLFLIVLVVAISGLKMGTAGSDMGKAASAVMSIKNAAWGVAVVLIAVPIFLGVIGTLAAHDF